MAMLIYANSFISRKGDESQMIGVSKGFCYSLLPRLLENKEYSNYSNDGPEHHPEELGWTFHEQWGHEKIYLYSPFSIFIRSLNYGGEKALKPLLKDMRLRHLETFPKFLHEFNLSCLESLDLNYSTEKTDDIPIKLGSIKSLRLFRPNNKLRLSGYIDRLEIMLGFEISGEIFDDILSVGELILDRTTIIDSDFSFVTGEIVSIRFT